MKFTSSCIISAREFCSASTWFGSINSRPCRTTETNVVTLENMNQNLVQLEYAIRGPLLTRALEIEKELQDGIRKPFKTVIKANSGDAQALGQKPITYIRQVLACVLNPELMETNDFPSDIKNRANAFLNACGGRSVGSYSAAYGMEMTRRSVAEYIERRDGHQANWKNICISSGATTAIKNSLQLFCNDGMRKAGVMVPIPQYPLYSATLKEYNIGQVGYYLDEGNNWELDVDELERSLTEGNQEVDVKAIVINNPGNPTGQVLTRENIEDIIKFAYKHRLFILADEVYQHNVYGKHKFISFKKVLMEMDEPYNKQELASFMSVSKGYMSECGVRGGWAEYVNLDPIVLAHLLKTIEIAMLCPTTIGQTVISCVTKPPVAGEPSYDLWLEQKTSILDTLSRNARVMTDAFNEIEGFSCQSIQGSMYAFPRIELPSKIIKDAHLEGLPADEYYALNLLEKTGICVVPGSGFGQSPGTWHFRTSILPQPVMLYEMLDAIKAFHKQFIAKH